jgi:hypothetical protein
MPVISGNRSRSLLTAMLVVIIPGMLLMSGCNGSAGVTGGSSSSEATAGTFPATTPKPSVQPPPPALRDPRSAVYSYLLWTSYAYRILNSDVASRTFDPYEEVRVNSYVQFNRDQDRAIDQRLLVAKLKSYESQDSTSTVAMHEEWAYRYIDTATSEYGSPVLNAAYETTYTVVRLDGDWVVHSVEATSSGVPVE